MVITHNIQAANTNRQLNQTSKALSRSTEKLSSGYNINRAADNAAGLAISEKMRAQIRGLKQGSKNSTDGISLLQTADAALNEVNSILLRLKELSVQSANDVNTDIDRMAIQDEVKCLLKEIDRIGNDTEFNTMRIFQGGESLLLGPNGEGVSMKDIPFKDINLKVVNLQDGPFFAGSGGERLKLTAALKDGYSVENRNVNLDWDLIFGNGSTSYSNFRVAYQDDNGSTVVKSENLRNMPVDNFSYDNTTNTFSRVFKYMPDNGVSFEIKQKVKVVSPENAAYKYYDIKYEVKNTGKEASIDFMFHADTAYNNNDICEGYFVDGNRIKQNCVYTKNQTDINPSSHVYDLNGADFSKGLSIVDVDSALPFSECLRWDTGNAGPDMVSIGHYYNIWQWDYYNSLGTNNKLGISTKREDLGISLVWTGDSLATNENKKYSFKYGIVDVDSDSNLKDVPIKKSSASTIHVKHLDLWIQSGADTRDGIDITIGEMNTGVLGIRGLDMTSFAAATSANTKVDKAIEMILKQRSRIGAFQNRLEHAKSIADSSSENLQASETKIRDLDVADEMVINACNAILMKTGQSMLAQANQAGNGIVQLLQ